MATTYYNDDCEISFEGGFTATTEGIVPLIYDDESLLFVENVNQVALDADWSEYYCFDLFYSAFLGKLVKSGRLSSIRGGDDDFGYIYTTQAILGNDSQWETWLAGFQG